jgi:DNA-binding NarL/FixJ family response regulator
MAGGTEILSDGGCTDSVAALIDTLTEREHEILRAIAEGMPNKVIGAKLFISEKTVKTHVNHIFRKLGVTSRLQAALVFQSHQRALAAGSAGRNRSG